MKPYHQDNHVTIYNKDCRDMSDLPNESVQCVITSPPYWGLRKYAGEQELIWGDNQCEHRWFSKTHRDTRGVEGSNLTGRIPYKEGEARINYTDSFCSRCGAWKVAYGLEPTPAMYVQHTIEILREIRRVLRTDGVVFWNIGDSYAGSGSPGGDYKNGDRGDDYLRPYNRKGGILKPKDLCLIPFRLAIAAQEEGWWVRSVIIWSKSNPMPESVMDRPTESHEYILLFTKNSKYYWDADTVREQGITGDVRRPYTSKGAWDIDGRPESQQHGGEPRENFTSGRNIRTVWEFPTQPGPGGAVRNFAVFPEKIPELCIKAATPEVGCCAKCGAPWDRILEKQSSQFNIRVRDAKAGRATAEEGYKATQNEIDNYPGNHPDPGYRKSKGWQPTCKCNTIKPPVPSIVLDPFMGAGTTLWVAKKLNRRAIGYDISEEYCQLALERNRQMALELNI